jgi:hypothetical protein
VGVRVPRPELHAVLACVAAGGPRLRLEAEQKRELADRDGRIGIAVVRALVRARALAVAPAAPPDEFPLTEQVFQAVARKLGREVGIKRVRLILRRLIAAGVLEPAGSYRQAYRTRGMSGFRVRLLRVAVSVQRIVRGVRPRRFEASIGTGRRVEPVSRRRWWAHPLFGTPDGRPPPHLTAEAARRMRSIDELECWLR